MFSRRQGRRAILTTGTFASLASLGLWLVSFFLECEFNSTAWSAAVLEGRLAISSYGGALEDIQALRFGSAKSFRRWECTELDWKPGLKWGWTRWRWQLGLYAPRVNMFNCGGPAYRNLMQPVESRVIVVPLWLIVTLVGGPSILLWRYGRRRFPAQHCQRCGYDLTGNVSGRCPECGTPASPQASRDGKEKRTEAAKASEPAKASG